MNRDYDLDGLDSLVAAVAKQWLADCPAELALVCDWLGITSEEALRRQTDTGIVPTWTGATCIVCRRPVQRGRRGRQGKYCSARCKTRYLKQQKERIMDFEEIEAQAAQVKATFEAQAAKVKGDRFLSQEGQAKRLAELEATYRAQVGTAMQRAAELIASEREAASKALKAAQTKAAAAERELIGPEILAGFLRAEVTGADGPDVLRMVENAPDDWTRAVILRAGLVELRARARAEGAPSAALTRLEAMAANPETAKIEKRLRLLASYEGRAREWSPDRERELRQRFGL